MREKRSVFWCGRGQEERKGFGRLYENGKVGKEDIARDEKMNQVINDG